jgi:DNA repair protein RadC
MNAFTTGIKCWPSSERPRERLLQNGAKSLSDAELVAVLLRSGVKGKDAVTLARCSDENFPNFRLLCLNAYSGANS